MHTLDDTSNASSSCQTSKGMTGRLQSQHLVELIPGTYDVAPGMYHIIRQKVWKFRLL